MALNSHNYRKTVFRTFKKDSFHFKNETFYYWEDVKRVLGLTFGVHEYISPGFVLKSNDGIVGISKPGLQQIEKYSKLQYNAYKYF